MEDSDRIRDDEVTSTGSEGDNSEQDIGNIPTRKHVVTTSGNEEWNKQQILQQQRREKAKPHERIGRMEKAIKSFRIATAGDAFLRGGFGKLPDNPAASLLEQMANLSKAMDQFHLVGDNLNVQGSFDKGYAISRENPCQQQQVNQNPE